MIFGSGWNWYSFINLTVLFMSSIIHVYQVQLRWSVSESITVIWHSRVSLPSWGDGKKGSSTFVYGCDTFTSDFNLTIATIIWTKTSRSPLVWAYNRTGINLRNISDSKNLFTPRNRFPNWQIIIYSDPSPTSPQDPKRWLCFTFHWWSVRYHPIHPKQE